ncbi:hypothetical protein J437_LFUL010355 [Ladona fulva]|uniref:Uncharacterized protein n=1 Tax=Ladona fulva TaxID=123851 RepID=A0A8K0P3B5_LADFU|nr:hypothetical protein J437_LFUL010355 [Ladona fulva]
MENIRNVVKNGSFWYDHVKRVRKNDPPQGGTRDENNRRETIRLFKKDGEKYLGVTLDCTLSYKEHLKKTAAKIKTRNYIVKKLIGSTRVPVF